MTDDAPTGTVLYEVTVEVPEARAAAFVEYMVSRHIEQVIGTGCFTGASFATAGEGHFRTSYSASSRAELERYLRDHAEALRRDFAEHFSEGVRVSREIWMELQRIPH